MKNIAVLVSGGGTNLQALIDAVSAGVITHGRIALVLSSNPDAFALQRAERAGIESAVVCHTDFFDRGDFTHAVVEKLREYDIDLCVLAGFMYILSPEFTKAFPNAIINIHPALIPSFCGDGFYGLRVHRAVLERGVKLTGATAHFVNEITDGGPIIMQKSVAVEEGDTPELLQRRVMEQAEWDILPRSVELFCAGRLAADGNIVHILPEDKK